MEINIRSRLRDRIRELRKKRGYTKEKLSELADIDYKYIQRIESKNPPAIKVGTIERLAKALKVRPSELF